MNLLDEQKKLRDELRRIRRREYFRAQGAIRLYRRMHTEGAADLGPARPGQGVARSSGVARPPLLGPAGPVTGAPSVARSSGRCQGILDFTYDVKRKSWSLSNALTGRRNNGVA